MTRFSLLLLPLLLRSFAIGAQARGIERVDSGPQRIVRAAVTGDDVAIRLAERIDARAFARLIDEQRRTSASGASSASSSLVPEPLLTARPGLPAMPRATPARNRIPWPHATRPHDATAPPQGATTPR